MQVEFVPGGKDHGWYFKDGNGCVLMAHGEPVPLLVAHEIAGRLSSGWMPWHGGLIPAGAHGWRVDIQFRDGEIFQNRPAGAFSWHHFDIEGDIVFWRVSPLPAVPGEHAQGLEAKLAAGNAMATQLEQQPVASLAADAGIDGMEAYEAWHRVKGLAESGATPQIDAHDVLSALAFCERENKALLEKKTSAGRAYQNHIAWLEDQLAKARASAGGRRELVAAAISIRDRLVDYFRYVAEGLPFERAAEANERAQALINALGLLANDLEAGRLADQCTRLHRNQLLGELDEARAALDASQGQVKQLEAEVAELRDLADRQADLLSRTAVAIHGPKPDLTRWSHHNLPDLAAAMRKQRDICASAANKIQWATPDYSHQEGVCPECGQYEHDGHSEGRMVGRACGIYDVLRLTGGTEMTRGKVEMSISNKKTVWVAYTNTDCTEGRGYDIPIAVCELEVTARRLARGRYVQGSDGPVRPVDLLEINGEWYAPSNAFYVKEPTREDEKEQARLDAKREALEKARAAGLTEGDLSALGISSGGR